MPVPLSPPAASAPVLAPARPEFFIVEFRPGPAWVPGRAMEQQDLRAHARYNSDLVRENRAFAAGGWGDADGGLAILRVLDADEAAAVVNADPAVQRGVFVAEVRWWRPRFVSGSPMLTAEAPYR